MSDIRLVNVIPVVNGWTLPGMRWLAVSSSWTRTAGGFTDEHPKVRDVRAGHTKC